MTDKRPRAIAIIKAVLPDGLIWKPKPGDTLDRLYETIGEIFDDLLGDVVDLETLRIPLKTKWLTDLEREYGVTPSPSSLTYNSTEEERRKYLNALAYATRGNASADYIQNRLVRAGFPVTVIANQNPVKNPADFIYSGFKMCCIDQDTVDSGKGISYCRNPKAVCGYRSGELFVDGVTDYNRLLPEDPRRWNYVFFIGGELIGGLLLNDWNMELPHSDFWTPNNSTYRTKDQTKKNTGNQSLLVRDQFNTEEQEIYPDALDAGLIAALRMYDLQQDLGANAEDEYKCLLEDYDMSEPGVDYWPAIGGAARTKTDNGDIGGYISDYNLFVEPIAPWNSGVRRNELTIGVEYRLRMYLRIKDDMLPAIVNGDQILYDSTGNENASLTWVNIDITFVSESTDLDFVAAEGHNFSSGFQIDEVVLHKKIVNEIVVDPDMELPGLDNWDSFGSAVITKETDPLYQYFGTQCLKVVPSDFVISGARQSCLTVGKYYYICAHAAFVGGENTGKLAVKCGNTIVAESDFIDRYTAIEGLFNAESTCLDLVCTETIEVEPYTTYWDSIVLVEVALNEIKNIAPINIFEDGDMEKPDTDDWQPINSPTLSKESSDFYISSQCLKVEYDSTPNPGVTQNKSGSLFKTEIGRQYLIVCASKGDGVCQRNITIGTTKIKQWDNSAEWNLVAIPYTETIGNNAIQFFSEASDSGEYSLFDNIKIIPLVTSNEYNYPSNFNRFFDGDCQQPDSYFWVPINNAALTKVLSLGDRYLSIEYTDTLDHGVKQSILEIGKTYHISGKVRRENIVPDTIPILLNGSSSLWEGDSSNNDWQGIEVVFTATHNDIILEASGTTDTLHINNFSCIEIDPINEGSVNSICPSGRSLIFSGEDNYINCNVLGKDFVDPAIGETNCTIEVVGKFDNGIGGTIISRDKIGSCQLLIYINSSGNVVVTGTEGSVVSIGSVFDGKYNAGLPRYITIIKGNDETKIYIDGKFDNVENTRWTSIADVETLIGKSASEIGLSGRLTYLALYNTSHNYQWVRKQYNKWLDVLWSGSVSRENNKGINQLNNDLELYGKKIRAFLWMNAKDANDSNWYSDVRSGHYLDINGSGEQPLTQQNGEYPSDVSVVFKPEQFVALAGSGNGGIIFRSTDYGENWSQVYDSSEGTIYSLATFENGVALAGSYNNGIIFRSTDYGENWSQIYDSPDAVIYSLATFSNGVALAGTGYNGVIYRSTDYGENWSQVYSDSLGTRIYSLATFSNGVALAGSGNSGVIYRSTDYGENWSQVYNSSEIKIYSLATFSNGVVLAGSGNSGIIFRSTDYGENWSQIYDSPDAVIYSLATFSNGVALAGSGNSGIIFRSTDYGENWSQVYYSPETAIYSLAAFSNGVALAGSGNSGIIYRSTDYGENWSQVYDSSEAIIYSLAAFYKGIQKYYKSNNDSFCDIDNEDFIIHIITYAGSYGELLSKIDSGYGYRVEILNDYKLKITFHDGSSINKTSDISIPIGKWCFITVAISKSGNTIQMYCNGESILSNTALPSYSSLSNNEYLKVGYGSGCTISFISLWYEYNWFNSLPEDFFIGIYEKYLTEYKPNYWSRKIWNEENMCFPVGGPYVEQIVDKNKIPEYVTQPGLKNIINDDTVTINGISEKPCLCYRGVDAVEDEGVWHPYGIDQSFVLEESGSGDGIGYGQYTDLSNEDRAVLYKNGGVSHVADGDLYDIGLHDFVIEIIAKTGASTSVFCEKISSTVGYQILFDIPSSEVRLSICDGINTQLLSSEALLQANQWLHCFVVVGMNKGAGGQTGIIYINGVNTSGHTVFGDTIGTISNPGTFTLKGDGSDVQIAFFRMWKRYDWIDSVSQQELVTKLYSNYTDGGLIFPSSIPVTAHMWGDNIGTIPMIMVRDYETGMWHKLCHGSTKNNRQKISDTIKNGLSGIRMYPKYEVFGASNFDDIDMNKQNIEFIQLPKEKRRLFYHLLAQSKPLSSWAGLLIEWK